MNLKKQKVVKQRQVLCALECFEVAVSKSLQICLVEIVMKCKIFPFLNGDLSQFWLLLLNTCMIKRTRTWQL